MEFLAQLLQVINSLIELIGIENFCMVITIILIICIPVFIYLKIKYIKQKDSIAHSQMIMATKCQEIYYKIMKAYKSGGIDATQFNTMMMSELKSFLNQVSEMFTLITKKEVYATLRILKKNKTINKSKVIMLQYSENCERTRVEEFQKMIIGEIENAKVVESNTDFYEIIGDNRENREPYFYQSNLTKYNRSLKKLHKKEYQNTTKNWEELYCGRIVVPIRMDNNNLFFNEMTTGYDLIGFLTIDSKSKFAFSNRKYAKDFNLSILETYATYLYIVLNKYKYYLNKLEEKEDK